MTHPQWPSTRVRYLFDWMPDQDPALSKILMGLKGGVSSASWIKLAEKFLAHHCGHLNLKDAIILPIPSKTGLPDHAALWGKALSDLTRTPLVSPFRHQQIQKQKELKAEQRKSIQFDLAHGFSIGTNLPADRTASAFGSGYLIIVDDILTTGATTKAAAQALARSLKSAKSIEIWTLARRQRLAP